MCVEYNIYMIKSNNLCFSELFNTHSGGFCESKKFSSKIIPKSYYTTHAEVRTTRGERGVVIVSSGFWFLTLNMIIFRFAQWKISVQIFISVVELLSTLWDIINVAQLWIFDY